MDSAIIACAVLVTGYMVCRIVRKPLYDILAQLRQTNTEVYVVRRHLESREVRFPSAINREEPVIVPFPEDRVCE